VQDAARRRSRLAWISALALVTLIAAALGVLALRPVVPAPETRLEINTPVAPDASGFPASFALSPDGRKIIFAGLAEGRFQLWLRSLDSVLARPIAGTDGAVFPFWSPDSLSVAFFADSGRLKRFDIGDGSVQTLTQGNLFHPNNRGTWNSDGVILFDRGAGRPIYRASLTGGEPVAATRLEAPQQSSHRSPQFLPDGKHFLYYVQGSDEVRGVYVGQLDRSPIVPLQW
jgi:Tol biopolymer transport system component